MRIGGYIPCSLSDFPGKLAAVVFTQGCNWRCPWCHNPALVYPEQFIPAIPISEIHARLAARRRKLDGVVVTGGEPTLHADLASFLTEVKQFGFATKLDTNGSHPEVVQALLDADLVDFIAIDVKAPLGRYAEAAGTTVNCAHLVETLRLVRERCIPHQLRTTRWPGLTGADETEISLLVQGSPHIWQGYQPVN